jgi:hypothetical protein
MKEENMIMLIRADSTNEEKQQPVKGNRCKKKSLQGGLARDIGGLDRRRA